LGYYHSLKVTDEAGKLLELLQKLSSLLLDLPGLYFKSFDLTAPLWHFDVNEVYFECISIRKLLPFRNKYDILDGLL
jgi:hypothetical protein